jgi:DNA-binding NarL/FixJ family response regulator
MKTIRLLIVEDNPGMAASLKEYFSWQNVIGVGPIVHSVEELLALPKNDFYPTMILMDILLPGKSGIEGIPLAQKKWPGVIVVMNSLLEDSEAVYESLKAGALGYITKEMPLVAVKEALLIIYKTGSFMDQRIASKVLDYFKNSPGILKEKLTKKEATIVEGIKNGMNYRMIAAENHMTINEERFYIQKIYRKLYQNFKYSTVSKQPLSY